LFHTPSPRYISSKYVRKYNNTYLSCVQLDWSMSFLKYIISKSFISNVQTLLLSIKTCLYVDSTVTTVNEFLIGHYKIWYYVTYSINASKVWFICIVHTNLSNLVGKYSSSIMKNIRYSENKHNRTRPSLSFTRKLQMVNSRKHNCDEVSKWRHSVGSSSYPYQWCWHGIKHHDAARSTVVMLVAINVQKTQMI